ncbi:MAG: TonB family protein [Erythrobacteraceae bacterium]
MRAAVLALATLPALVAAPAQAEPVVVQPSSPWNDDFAEDKCRLSRLFGEGESQHMLAFQQYWPAETAGLTVAGPAFERFRSPQRTDVRFFEGQEPLRTRPFTGSVEQFGSGVIYSSIRITEAEPTDTNEVDEPRSGGIPQLNATEGDLVQFVALKQGGREVRLETGPLGEAFKVLNQCTLDLLRDWGLDPDKHVTATSLPRWTNQAALTRKIIANYPTGALAQGEQAIMRMRVIVSAEGMVESCTILKATNTTRLESPACEVMQGARFEPARDASGQPFRSLYATSITYRIG